MLNHKKKRTQRPSLGNLDSHVKRKDTVLYNGQEEVFLRLAGVTSEALEMEPHVDIEVWLNRSEKRTTHLLYPFFFLPPISVAM